MKTHYAMLDWTKTIAYAPTPSCNGVYFRRCLGPGQAGVPAERYESIRAEVASKLLAYTDPETGAPVVRSVHRGRRPSRQIHAHLAPDLLLRLPITRSRRW